MALIIPFTRAPLKNHRRNPYVITGMTQVRYNSLFCEGRRPLTELPSIPIDLTVVKALVV
jgi:hypothetical protein